MACRRVVLTAHGDEPGLGRGRSARPSSEALDASEAGFARHRDPFGDGVHVHDEATCDALAFLGDVELLVGDRALEGVKVTLPEDQAPVGMGLPVPRLKDAGEAVAVHRLDDESSAAAEHAAKLCEDGDVPVAVEVAE